MEMNIRGIALLVMIGIMLMYGQMLIYKNVPELLYPEMVIDCQPISPKLEIQEVASQPIIEVKTKTNKKDEFECPEDIVPDTITMRNNYDLTYESKWGDREQIHMPDGSNNARCYMGILYWQDPDYLYCENLLYNGDEGRHLMTVTLDTDRDYDRDNNMIEYEIVDIGCLRQ